MRAREHDHILPIYVAFVQAVTKQEEYLYIVTPLAVSDMEIWLTSIEIPYKPPELDDPLIRRTFLLESIASIVEAVAYCHSDIHGVWCGHYDIKPKNILLFQESEGRWLWKLADFGLSTLKKNHNVGIKDDIGTKKYHPPEYYKYPQSHLYGPSFDVFSTGCVVLQLATLVAFPWEPNILQECGSGDFAFQNPGMAVAWSQRIKGRTSDEQTHHVLETAMQMMAFKPSDRLLAFDAALDLREISTPWMDKPSYEQHCKRVIQGQGLHPRFSPCYKPIARVLSSARPENRAFRFIRVKHLRKVGWADVPVNAHPASRLFITNMPSSLESEPFCGRSEELAIIDALFTLNKTVSLYGIGGVGKSHLAWVYVRNAQQQAAGEGKILHAFWMQARNSSTLTASYASIAEAIGGAMIGSEGSSLKKDVLRWLKRTYWKEPWILVLDGVTTSYDWRERFPIGDGQVLITTRDQDLGSRFCASPDYTVQVKPLSVKDNIDLFFTMMSQPLAEDYEYAERLVNKLQLPILIKMMARTIDSGVRAGGSVRTMEEALEGRPALAKRLEELDITNPCSDGLLPTVKDIFDMLFETLKEETRVYGCNNLGCLSPDTKTSCRSCKRTINHSIEVLRLMCFFSRNNIEKRLITAENTDEKCEQMTEKAFVVLTSFCYINLSSVISQQFDIHDLVYTMFQSWFDKRFSPAKGRMRQWNGRMRALGMLLHDYKQERQNIDKNHDRTDHVASSSLEACPGNSVQPSNHRPLPVANVIPLSLLKLRYRNHVEEFVQYVRDGKSFPWRFKPRAAESIVTFARLFNEENRFDVSQLLLGFVIDQGIEDDTNRLRELHARIDLVSSIDQSLKGRNIGTRLEELLTKVNGIRRDIVNTGESDRLLRLCIIKKIDILHRLQRFPEAQSSLQDLSSNRSTSETEREKLRLTGLRLEALCLCESGWNQNNFEDLYKSRKIWQELIRAIPESRYDSIDISERLEDAEKNFFDTTLLLIENAHHRKRTPADFDTAKLCSSVYEFYQQFLEKKKSRYSDQGREMLKHRDIIDAERELVIANLRIGLCEGDSDKVEDAVASLNDILARYEKSGLDIQHQAPRNVAYRCSEGLSFLICHGRSRHQTDLDNLTRKYQLAQYQNLQPSEWERRQNSSIAWQVQTGQRSILESMGTTFAGGPALRPTVDAVDVLYKAR